MKRSDTQHTFHSLSTPALPDAPSLALVFAFCFRFLELYCVLLRRWIASAAPVLLFSLVNRNFAAEISLSFASTEENRRVRELGAAALSFVYIARCWLRLIEFIN